MQHDGGYEFMMGKQKRIIKWILVMLVCTFLNWLGRYLSDLFMLPFWMDTIGTCLAAYYTNLPCAIAAAVLVNVIVGFSRPVVFAYTVVGGLLAVLLRFFAKRGYLDSLTSAMISSFGVGMLAMAASTPLDIIFNQGYTGNRWGDALHAMLRFQEVPALLCTLADECIINVIDKQLCVFISFLIIHFVNRKYPGIRKERDISSVKSGKGTGLKGFSLLFAGIFLSASLCIAIPAVVQAEGADIHFQDYVKVIYNNANGLPSSEANAIAETKDGYIWIGGYAGLTRYDGTRFEYITEGGLSNVTALITDDRGRLWIGTNDRGIAVYENGQFRFLTKEDGLPANSIRTLMATKEGVVYAGTTGRLARIDKDYQITVPEKSLNCVTSLAVNSEGLIMGVDNRGMLFGLKEDRLIYCQTGKKDAMVYYTVYAAGAEFYVGTTNGCLLCMKETGQGPEVIETISSGEISSITQIRQDQDGLIWLCGDSGLGYLNDRDQVIVLNYPGFDSSIEGMLQDYEGNYWFASSRFGVMKLCKNAFSNIFDNAGIDGRVVNAVTEYQGKLYCGTDQGLEVIDLMTYETVENELTERIGEIRVRCLLVDSENRLWVCCYGGEGLLCYGEDGSIQTYTKEKDQTVGDRTRCLLELDDGTMVVGGSEGLTFIKDSKVIKTLSNKDGLFTTQILCLTAGEDGTIYAGSDGAGIYVIQNGELKGILTEEQGLSSLIVLRMTPYEDGWFVVTSNSLGYMENETVRKIEKFPYFNNYDIQLHGQDAWILSSRGIFVADIENLLSEEELKYKIYDTNNGLLNSITANAWVYIDDENQMYFCTNKGVEKIYLLKDNTYSGEYKIQIGSFTADGENVQPKNGIYEIEEGVERIAITPSICNYMLNDLKVCAYVEGLDSNPSIVRQSMQDTLIYTNVPHGTYTLHIQIYDDNEEHLLQESTYKIEKQAQMWEETYFKIYLAVVLLWTVSFATWVIYSLRQTIRHRRELEKMSEELEKRVQEQTAAIQEQSRKMTAMQWGVIEGMAALIESRDGNTGKHVRNTRQYVKLLASELLHRGMYPEEITPKFVENVAEVAPLHDVGKIKISDVVLNKPGRLTKEEFEVMKNHTFLGGEIITDILGNDAEPELVQMAKDIAVYHHEKWDGSGYPYGKKGKEIPLAARIMAVADVFDALVSKRVYKEAMTIEEDFAEIKKCAGTHFDPEIAQVFLELKTKISAFVLKDEAL